MARSVTKTQDNHFQNIPDLKWVDRITRVMDSNFRVPGTNFRFGLDPILGLIPGLGDATSLAISGALVYYMAKHGASRKVVIMMLGNVALDALFGSIPVLGNLFDFFYKANTRNIRLLKRHYAEKKYQGKGTGILMGVAATIIGVIGLLIYGTYELVSYLSTVQIA
ncbi:DUF4112 domain-containing protein [Tunicatimonas pelagia]|uniref:DUF4112 domain-containing protein n=1 Tax=Tunicatimonas pelagia TaxID=931531 RepID=UPI002665120A|nr:DUF4112 domain-containing protein [Tunicatimonas pelagia]WKN40459.1 DUF4112 domain-containing protein [Tunicatimonas pelagia]